MAAPHTGKPLCAVCKKRPARFKFKGRYQTRKNHDLCLQCFRSHAESLYQTKKFAA